MDSDLELTPIHERLTIEMNRRLEEADIPEWMTKGNTHIGTTPNLELTSIHDRQTIEMNRCLEEADIPEWMTKGNTRIGTTTNNY